MDKLEEKMSQYLDLYGIDTINLVIRRHDLASEKRTWFTVRFASTDPVKEAECTKEMDRLSVEIEKIDKELESLGINSKNRPTITKNIKKYCPDGWFSGFYEGF